MSIIGVGTEDDQVFYMIGREEETEIEITLRVAELCDSRDGSELS